MSDRDKITEHWDIMTTVLCFIFICVFWIALGLRLYVRRYITKNVAIEDWLLLLASISASAAYAFTLALSIPPWITGRMTYDTMKAMFELTPGVIVFHGLTMIFFKAALGLFFMRLVNTQKQRRAITGIIVVYTLLTVATVLIFVFQCGWPGQWMQKSISGQCRWASSVLESLQLAHGICSALVDACYASVPIYLVAKSRMPPSMRVATIALLLLMLIGSVVTITRVSFGLNKGEWIADKMRLVYRYLFLMSCEIGVGLSAASLATLKPLFKHDSPRASSSVLSPVLGDSGQHSEQKSPMRRLTFGSTPTNRPDLLRLVTVISVRGRSDFSQESVEYLCEVAKSAKIEEEQPRVSSQQRKTDNEVDIEAQIDPSHDQVVEEMEHARLNV